MLARRGSPLKHSFTPESLTPKTPLQLRHLLANALRLQAEDVVLMVQEEMALRLYGPDLPKEIAARLEASLQEFERLKAAELDQRGYKALRARQAIRKGGLKAVVEGLVQKKDGLGLQALPFAQSFEAVILDYPEQFSESAVAAAQERRAAAV